MNGAGRPLVSQGRRRSNSGDQSPNNTPPAIGCKAPHSPKEPAAAKITKWQNVVLVLGSCGILLLAYLVLSRRALREESSARHLVITLSHGRRFGGSCAGVGREDKKPRCSAFGEGAALPPLPSPSPPTSLVDVYCYDFDGGFRAPGSFHPHRPVRSHVLTRPAVFLPESAVVIPPRSERRMVPQGPLLPATLAVRPRVIPQALRT